MVKMLTFENQSKFSSFKCSTLPLDRPSNFFKMKRKLRLSVPIEEGRCQEPPSTALMVLPVPTVPPYPIEMFETGCRLGHINRAFNLTDEFPVTTNAKTTATATTEVFPSLEAVRSARPSPEGAVYSVSGTGGEDESFGYHYQFSRPYANYTDDGRMSGSGSGSWCVDERVKGDSCMSGGQLAKDGSPPGCGFPPDSHSLPNSSSVLNGAQLSGCKRVNWDPLSNWSPNGSPLSNDGCISNGSSISKSGTVSNNRRSPSGSSASNSSLPPNDGPPPRGGLPPNGGLLPNGGLSPNGSLPPNGGRLPNDGLPPNSGLPPKDGSPPRGGLPPNGGSLPNNGTHLNGNRLPNGGLPQYSNSTRIIGPVANGGPHTTSGPLLSGRRPYRLNWRPLVKRRDHHTSGNRSRHNEGPAPAPGALQHPSHGNHLHPEDNSSPPLSTNTGTAMLEDPAGRHHSHAINHVPTARPSNEPLANPSGNRASLNSDGGASRLAHNSATDTRANKALVPIYSKVCKPKKSRNKQGGEDRSHSATREDSRATHTPLRSSDGPLPPARHQDVHSRSCGPQPIVPQKTAEGSRSQTAEGSRSQTAEGSRSQTADGINPLYEDLKEFEDDRAEERQYNIEVKIDYSRGSKYQMETRHVVKTKDKNGDNATTTHSSDIAATAVGVSGTKREKAVARKLREVGEMKSFKLGVIHVIRLGKWRFVALCCCGNTSRYVHQPGRIEDYVPGYSSLSEKELKKNPEADVKLESHSQEPPPVSVNHRFGSQKMSMTHALKESGYESDSTLVFRKREDARRQIPDPRKTSQVYRQIQRGGDIPFTGLQKANPPRPRESPYKYESGEVNIHYRTPVRIEQKESIPEEELARRQEEHMKKVYENERRKKYLAELEDIERRRHTDNFTPLQKSPIPLNRYDDESSLGTMRGARTPDLKQVAKALYNFTAQNKRELTFNKGDVIFIRRQIDKNWYEGEFRGSVGIFPCNYIEIVPYENVKTLTRKPTEGQARARFNFQAQTSMEMSLSKGELVVLTRRVDENWYEGRIGNRKGIFPVSYVDTLVEPGSDRPMTPSSSSPMPRPALPAANLLYNGASTYSSPYSTLGRPGSQNDSRPYNQSLTVNTQQEPVAYRALYNYKPQNDDELELLESDIVMVMEKCDDGWFVGTSRRTGLFGTFPGNYVERV